eukprot:COSAG01_NODE_14753_length_1414_cov_1.241065_1_plen_71_part_10
MRTERRAQGEEARCTHRAVAAGRGGVCVCGGGDVRGSTVGRGPLCWHWACVCAYACAGRGGGAVGALRREA